MGVRLLPQRSGDSVSLRAARPTLVVSTDAGIVEVRTGSAAHVVDRASVVLLAQGVFAEIAAKSPIAHALVLTVSDALVGTVLRTYAGEVDRRRIATYLGATALLPRTNWLNEICHRYLFERAVCRKSGNDATRFLETEIVKEIYFLCHDREQSRERSSVVDGESKLVQRAVRMIEDRLFEADVLRALAASCGASGSTLLRAFKRELGQGPLAYVRARRLDEAMILLKSRQHSVSEIATMVGYGNFAAFSHAFRARFGARPSEVRVWR
jgi:AraC-like DNA-binding protein